jgi:hypothetical protein
MMQHVLATVSSPAHRSFMRAIQLIAILAGLQSFGCVADAVDSKQGDEDASSQVSSLVATGTQQDPNVSTGVRCSDKDWQITFWAEPQMITPVGYMTCSCWQLEDLTGRISDYSSLNYESTCDTN